MNLDFVYFGGTILSIALIGLHCCSLYVCVTSKELKKLRFLRLTLFLSLSDCMIGVQSFSLGIRRILIHYNIIKGNDFECILILTLASGTVQSSLLQTLLIAVERLNATFTHKKRLLTILGGNLSVGFCVMVPHCFALLHFGIQTSHGLPACDPKYTINPQNLVFHDMPVVILIVCLSVLYGVILIRMKRQKRTIHIGTLTEAQLKKQKTTAVWLRRNIVTLGFIIFVAIISSFPRIVTGFYVYFEGSLEQMTSYTVMANSLFILINPLLDPFIYIFRIKKYRELLVSKCKCCDKRHPETEPNRAETSV